MNLLNLIKEKILFCIRNKMADARETLIDIFIRINKESEHRKRKLSEREIKAITKKYIQEQQKALKQIKADTHKHIIERGCIEGNISIAELVLCGFANGKQPVSKTGTRKGTGGSSPPPHVKKGP